LPRRYTARSLLFSSTPRRHRDERACQKPALRKVRCRGSSTDTGSRPVLSAGSYTTHRDTTPKPAAGQPDDGTKVPNSASQIWPKKLSEPYELASRAVTSRTAAPVMAAAQSPGRAALTTTQSAAMLGVSRCTMEGWRVRGGGPRFLKLSRGVVRYHPSALHAWIETRSVANTAQADALSSTDRT
jgi:predicted DNA-binding transcriptional regulator AlpA